MIRCSRPSTGIAARRTRSKTVILGRIVQRCGVHYSIKGGLETCKELQASISAGSHQGSIENGSGCVRSTLVQIAASSWFLVAISQSSCGICQHDSLLGYFHVLSENACARYDEFRSTRMSASPSKGRMVVEMVVNFKPLKPTAKAHCQ